MTGIDTTFLIQVAVAETPQHKRAIQILDRYNGEKLCLAPQVLTEFIHVVTDAKRFTKPLTMLQAIQKSEEFWNASDIIQVLPKAEATDLMHRWLQEFNLGRKRILDTQLAAVYYSAGIGTILSSNGRDFTVFGKFEIIEP